jgi:hypothetical protein
MIRKFSLVVLLIGVLVAVSAASATAAYDPSGPVPEQPGVPAGETYSEADVDAVVSSAPISIYKKAPRLLGIIAPPPQCDYIKFIRHKVATASNDASQADAALLMVPGILESAGGFDYIARHLIYQAKTQRNKNIEVWAMDRRNNCLEDLHGAQLSENEPDIDTAIQNTVDYYYNGETLGGKKFNGFLTSNQVPYLAEFGLKMDTEDMYTIMKTLVPSRATRKSKVYVGGHSLGGIHTSVFASWDFDGLWWTTSDAGYNNTAGLFAFDSVVAPTSEAFDNILRNFGVPPELIFPLDPFVAVGYEAVVDGLRTGIVPRIFPLPIPDALSGVAASVPGIGSLLGSTGAIDAETMALTEAIGMMADRDPDRDMSSLMRSLPLGDNVRKVLVELHSRDQESVDRGTPSIFDFNYTAEGLFGAVFDDSMSSLGFVQTSMGFPNGGPVVRKDYPSDAGLWIPSDAGPSLNSLRTGPLYGWTNFDEFGAENRSADNSTLFTDASNEVADIRSLARATYRGETNLTEWYFSLRRIVDIVAASRWWGPGFGINTIWKNKVKNLPALEFIAEDGVIAGDDGLGLGQLPRPNHVFLPGQNHLDPLFEVANKPGQHVNQTIPNLLDFVL